MLWKDVKLGHNKYIKGTVTQIHEANVQDCYQFTLANAPKGKNTITVSGTHLVLCNTILISNKHLKYIFNSGMSPKEIELVRYNVTDYTGNELERMSVFESANVKMNKYWLSAKAIHYLLKNNKKVYPVGNKFLSSEYVGKKECFCISTEEGKYSVCGLIHHNSVSLRDVILHSLTHSDDISWAGIDLKLSEFERYKKVKGCVGIANNVKEAAELLRMAREVMSKRNKFNAEHGITDIADYQPTQPTNKIKIFGREFDENEMFEVKIAGEVKKMSAKDLLEWYQING